MRWLVAPAAAVLICPLWIPLSADQPDPTGTPEPAEHLFYHRSLKKLVMLVDSRRTGKMQVWVDENGRWALIDGEGPPARELGGAAYDVHRSVIVLHGGIRLAPSERGLSDTWEWDGKAWHERARGATPRDHHAMAYDERRRRTVLVGGQASADALATDTWEWDGDRWTRIPASVGGGRAHIALAYDGARKQVVLFGGLDERYRAHNDTWSWDGRIWHKLSEDGPPARSHHRMAFDRGSEWLVLFGGLADGRSSRALGDTWLWNGSSWTPSAATGPPPRSGQMMTYDDRRSGVVLVRGGSFDGKQSTRYDDIWAWTDRWTMVR
jgi:hypothetical protein